MLFMQWGDDSLRGEVKAMKPICLELAIQSVASGQLYSIVNFFAFIALTLLVGQQEGKPACKRVVFVTEWWAAGMAICLE